MSKKKNFGRGGTGKKMLLYGSAQGLGPFQRRPKLKKTAAGAADTEK